MSRFVQKKEFEEMVGQANFSDATVHFILFDEFEPDTDELLFAAYGSTPVGENFYEGH